MSSLSYVCSGILLLLVAGYAVAFGVNRWHFARTATFCKAVAALPQSGLDAFASRCDRLASDRGGPSVLEFLSDSNILAGFSLAGVSPHHIVVEDDTIGVHFFHYRRQCALVVWKDDYSQSGDPVKVLRTCWGDSYYQDVYTRAKQNGEPGGAANQSQPVRPGTNRASAAAGSGR